MTVPSGTFQTFTAIGQREDLTDVIYNISPTETPCLLYTSPSPRDRTRSRMPSSA